MKQTAKPKPAKSRREIEAEIVAAVVARFRCFGRGTKADPSNPITVWTKDDAPMFAGGVDVADVVRFVWDQIAQREVVTP